MEITDESGMMQSFVDKDDVYAEKNTRSVQYVHIPAGATPDTFNLDDNIVYAIPIEDVEVFTMTVYPSEKELKTFYQNNFVLDEITKEGYYVFKRRRKV